MAASIDSVISAIHSVPVTIERPVPKRLEDKLPSPGLPRANKAVSREVPQGTTSFVHPHGDDYTVIQQHVAFFDRDDDGVIWPQDTYIGFRRLGFGRIISSLAVPFIHGSFSYPSANGVLPDPFFRINIKNMHRCKHGSDSEVYDTEGRFVPEKFEELFSKYDRTNKGGLSWADVNVMIQANMNIVDPVGWVAERLEWWTFYLLAAEDGMISKEKVRAQYDGSLWYLLADEKERRDAVRQELIRGKWD